MSRTFAMFLSYLIHPAIMPVIGVAFILMFSPYYIHQELFLLVLVYVFAGTYLFPLLMIVFLKKLGIVSSLQLPTAQERRYPFLAAILFYYLTAQSVRNFPVPESVGNYLLAGVFMLFIAFLLLRFTKLSAHMAGIGGLTGLFFYISIAYNINLLLIIALLLLLSGFLGTARLVLRAHKPIEVYLGFLLGSGSVVGFLFWFTHSLTK